MRLVWIAYGAAAMAAGACVLYGTGRSLHALLVRSLPHGGAAAFWAMAAAVACAAALNVAAHLARARAAKTPHDGNFGAPGS
jgi:hypothetical protein